MILKSTKYHWHIRFAHHGIAMGNKKKFALLTVIEDKRMEGGGGKKGYLEFNSYHFLKSEALGKLKINRRMLPMLKVISKKKIHEHIFTKNHMQKSMLTEI